MTSFTGLQETKRGFWLCYSTEAFNFFYLCNWIFKNLFVGPCSHILPLPHIKFPVSHSSLPCSLRWPQAQHSTFTLTAFQPVRFASLFSDRQQPRDPDLVIHCIHSYPQLLWHLECGNYGFGSFL